jgi:hypothetical protein
MNYFRILIIVLLNCTTAVMAVHSPSQSQRTPPQRYEDKGACPFECCTYREWTVTTTTVFYKDRTANSPIAFRSQKGDRVTGLTGVVITLKPGKAFIKKAGTLGEGKNIAGVKQGEELYLLNYVGEGYYKFWLRGRIYSDQMAGGNDIVNLLKEPQTVWWVKVKDRQGRTGWSKQTNHFNGMDACG